MMLRTAENHDLPGVLALWQTAAENSYRAADTPGALAALHLRDPDALILAVDGNDLVGTIVAGWDGWRAHLYRLAVDPARRRSGIARMLVEAAEERFRKLGATRADAMVLDDNELAHGVWAACGYHSQPENSRWVKPL